MDSALATAHEPDSLRFMCYLDSDDITAEMYPQNVKNLKRFIGRPWSAVMASNYLAQKCREFFPQTFLYMVGSDDMVFATPEWDKVLYDVCSELRHGIHVFSLRDSRNAAGTPHPVMTRAYVDAMGYFLPPVFLHWFVDTWTVEIAKANNCFTHLKDYLLIHDKPSDRGQPDETHTRIRNFGWHERDTFVNHTCQHFLALEKERLGRIIQHNATTREYVK